MIIVRDEELARQVLDAQELACPWPSCGGTLRRDGYARTRWVRTRAGQNRILRPRRARCRRCDRVHVLLPSWSVPRRADDMASIGTAMLHAALGRGHRVIAAMLGRPVSTVRGWLRAARSNADRAGRHAYLLRRLIEPTYPTRSAPHARTPLAYAVDDLGAAAAALRRHVGNVDRQPHPWATFTFVGGFLLLAPARFLTSPRPAY